MLAGIFNKVKQFINIAVFIVFIPELFFTLPKNGSRGAIAAVHGILYSLCYIFLNIIFDAPRTIFKYFFDNFSFT